MRKLIDYIRSCFCRHNFELLDEVSVYRSEQDKIPIGKKWTYCCKKCGYFKVNKNYSGGW